MELVFADQFAEMIRVVPGQRSHEAMAVDNRQTLFVDTAPFA